MGGMCVSRMGYISFWSLFYSYFSLYADYKTCFYETDLRFAFEVHFAIYITIPHEFTSHSLLEQLMVEIMSRIVQPLNHGDEL